MIKPRFLTIAVLIFATAALRLLPHWPNFTPVVPLALFAGAHLQNRYLAFGVPLAALLLSDIFLGFYPAMPFVYFGFALSVVIGMFMARRQNATRLFTGALGGGLIFYVLSNFGVWWTSTLYPHTLGGCVEAYIAALPFLRNALLGDAVYVVLLFGGFWLAEQRFTSLRAGVPALKRSCASADTEVSSA